MTLSPRLSFPGNWPGASVLPENGIQHLYLIMWEPILQSHQNGSALISEMEGTNPLTMTEWLSSYIWPTHQNGLRTHHFPLEGTSIWRTPSFSLNYSNFTLDNGFVNTLAICSWMKNILELHCSPLHHIPNIVILDLDMLRLVMEH